jgi:hypothetical protein
MGKAVLTAALVALSPLALAELGIAQETPAAEAQPQAEATVPRPSIRVLQSPYDISSFYRSGGSAPSGWAGLASDPAYSIAGFYRSQADGTRSPYGWSRFWTNGYSARRPRPLPGFRRSIGQNGDLFLVVPFLAPVGPISTAFFEF